MRHHQDHDPYGEAEQYYRRINTRNRPYQGRHALAAPESRENGEDVSEHGGEYGDDLDIYQPHIVDVGVVFEDLGQCDRDESLEPAAKAVAAQRPAGQSRSGADLLFEGGAVL